MNAWDQINKALDGMQLLDTSEIPRDSVAAAQFLLGKLLLRVCAGRNFRITHSGIIIETEAYLETDPASHSFSGKTPRNQSMYGPPGSFYVYRSYGIHNCLNVVTAPKGRGEAVLIRSLFPVTGRNTMFEARFGNADMVQGDCSSLCSGPGKLTQSFGIDRKWDGYYFPDGGDLSGDMLLLCSAQGAACAEPGTVVPISAAAHLDVTGAACTEPGTVVPDTGINGDIYCSKRIGISKNQSALWRFFLPVQGFVSRSIKGHRVVSNLRN